MIKIYVIKVLTIDGYVLGDFHFSSKLLSSLLFVSFLVFLLVF